MGEKKIKQETFIRVKANAVLWSPLITFFFWGEIGEGGMGIRQRHPAFLKSSSPTPACSCMVWGYGSCSCLVRFLGFFWFTKKRKKKFLRFLKEKMN